MLSPAGIASGRDGGPWYRPPVPDFNDPILVTGANGHIGQALARAVSPRPVRALVRSERAAGQLRALGDEAALEIRQVDYSDEGALLRAGEGCASWVHLIGILKETRDARYVDAHERPSEALARAAEKAGAERIVSLSILGATPSSTNACLASKGRADALLLEGNVPATVLRLPMVLGPNEIAAMALRGKALAPVAFLTRGGRSKEQPIDTRDVTSGIVAAVDERSDQSHALDLAGPVSLSHRKLVERVASTLGSSGPFVVPVPYGLVAAFAAVAERISANPPLSRAMLGVLDHDDEIDPSGATRALGLELTPLDDTLRATFSKDPE